MSAFSMRPCSAGLLVLSWHLTRRSLVSSVKDGAHEDISGDLNISNMSEYYQSMLHRHRGDARPRAGVRERKMYEQRLQHAPAGVGHN